MSFADVIEAAESGEIVLDDGARVAFRPIAPTDQSALQRFHARLSDRSVYQRFFMVKPRLGDDQAYYFTHLDAIDRFALVALDPEDAAEIIAVVRFDRDPGTDRAEYAAVVADRWQGRGLGLALTHHLIAAARRRGIATFFAIVLPGNARMLGLFRDLGYPERVVQAGSITRVEIHLGGA